MEITHLEGSQATMNVPEGQNSTFWHLFRKKFLDRFILKAENLGITVLNGKSLLDRVRIQITNAGVTLTGNCSLNRLIMLSLCFFICFSVSFHQSLRYGQQHGMRISVFAGFNYLIATILNFILLGKFGIGLSVELDRVTIYIGIINGVLYVLHLMIVVRCYRIIGVGLTWAVATLGIVMPILISWAFWNESISLLRWTGISLLPIAILLMRPNQETRFRWNFKQNGLLLLNFLLAGTIVTLHKKVSMSQEKEILVFYQVFLFMSATVFPIAYLFYKRIIPTQFEILVSTAAGLFNALSTYCLLSALGVLLTVVVLTTGYFSIIGLNLLLDKVIWRKHWYRRQLVGCAIAVGIIILINL